jgi:small subunit ribosomal protein S20
MRTSEDERTRNRALRSQMTKALKNIRQFQTKAEVENHLRDVIAIIDRASQKNIIHKNKAARDKSKLMSFYNRLS